MQQIKKIFRFLGFEITRSRDERRTLFQAVKHLKNLNFRPELIIDAGVAHGTPGIYQNYPDSKLLLIEPLKEYKGSLELICNKYSNFMPIEKALSSSEGELQIYVKKSNSGSSQFKEENEDIVDQRSVPTVTLKSLLSQYYTKGPILLKMDIEGGELDVIINSKNELKLVDVVILEVTFLPKLEGCPSFSSIMKVMIDYEFEVFDIVDKRYYNKSKNLFQADFVFVKKESFLRKNSKNDSIIG